MFKKISEKEIIRMDRQNALLQNVKQTEDIETVAEMTTLNALDKDELAEMLVYALQKIDELEGMING